MHLSLLSHLKKFPSSLAWSVLLSSLAAIGLIYQQRLVAFFVNAIIFLDVSTENLKIILFIILCIILIRTVLYFFSEITAKRISKNVKKELRQRVVKQLIENNYLNLHTGEVIHLMLTKVEALEDYFSKFLPQVFLSIFIPLFIIIFVFPIDFITAVIFFITAPLIPFFMVLIGKYGEKITKKQWQSLNRLTIFFLDSIRGIKTILQFNQKKDHLIRIEKANKDFVKKTMSVLRITFLSAFVLELVSTLSIAIVAVEIGLRLLYSQISFEQAFFIILIAPEFYLPLRNLGLRFHAAINGVDAYKEIATFILNEKITSTTKENNYFENVIKKVDFENVSFKYPKSENDILENFSYVFEAGHSYAIVGPNGAGKTTLVSLLLGFLRPQSGSIRINDLNTAEMDQQSLYKHIGWLPANPAIFQGSIFENIAIANPQLTIEKAIDLLKLVDLEQFIESLPQNLNTEIQEHGISLSSGQKQKIGLLRIFARDCSLILCDEPTASLDQNSKKMVLKLFDEIKKNKIIIMVAHDLITAKSADKILFLDPGSQITSGSFDFLNSSNERFKFYVDHYFQEQ